jgi:hypothetical protein
MKKIIVLSLFLLSLLKIEAQTTTTNSIKLLDTITVSLSKTSDTKIAVSRISGGHSFVIDNIVMSQFTDEVDSVSDCEWRMLPNRTGTVEYAYTTHSPIVNAGFPLLFDRFGYIDQRTGGITIGTTLLPYFTKAVDTIYFSVGTPKIGYVQCFMQIYGYIDSSYGCGCKSQTICYKTQCCCPNIQNDSVINGQNILFDTVHHLNAMVLNIGGLNNINDTAAVNMPSNVPNNTNAYITFFQRKTDTPIAHYISVRTTDGSSICLTNTAYNFINVGSYFTDFIGSSPSMNVSFHLVFDVKTKCWTQISQ